MVTTYTSKFRLAKPQAGILDWYPSYYDSMDIIDSHVPRIFMSAPRILLPLVLSAGGSLTAGRFYFYKVVAYNASAQSTLASWEDVYEEADVTNKTITVNWSAVAGATDYKVYRIDNGDPSVKPDDSAYLFLGQTAGTSLIDDGTAIPAGVMPTTLDWYVTEIDQKYVMPAAENSVQHGSPVDLSENLDNIRYIIKAVNGETNWDDAPLGNLTFIYAGRPGGQTFYGGNAGGEYLYLFGNADGDSAGHIILNNGESTSNVGISKVPGASYKLDIAGSVSLEQSDSGARPFYRLSRSGDHQWQIRLNDDKVFQIHREDNGVDYITIRADTPNSVWIHLNANVKLEYGAMIANKVNADVDIGTEDVDTFADTAFSGCVWHFVVKNGANLRAGTITACWDAAANTVKYNEYSTDDVGDTSGLSLAVDINADIVRLRATATSDNWRVVAIRNSLI